MYLNHLLIFCHFCHTINHPGRPFSFPYCQLIILSYSVIFLSLPPIFARLGRLTPGGSKGPGIFFVLPCIEKWDDAKRQRKQKPKIEIENTNQQIKKMRRIECWKIRVPVHRTIRADAWLRKSPLCRLNEIALNLANVHTFSKMRNSSFCKCKSLQCIALGNQAECKCRWRKHIYLHDPVAKCMLAKLKRGNQMKTKSIFIAMTSLPTACWPLTNWRKGNQLKTRYFLYSQPGQLEKRKPHEN